MIQKRFQYWGKNGQAWTAWMNYRRDNSLLEKLRSEEEWQIRNKLRNEYRIV